MLSQRFENLMKPTLSNYLHIVFVCLEFLNISQLVIFIGTKLIGLVRIMYIKIYDFSPLRSIFLKNRSFLYY